MSRHHHLPGLESEADAFRGEVCAWLTECMAPERVAGRDDPADRTGVSAAFGRELQREAGSRGWLGISLPADIGGGGQPPSFAAAFGYEAAYHDAPLIDTAIVLAGGAVEGTLFGRGDPQVPAGGRFGYEYLFRFDGSAAVGANEIHRSAGFRTYSSGWTKCGRPTAPGATHSANAPSRRRPTTRITSTAVRSWSERIMTDLVVAGIRSCQAVEAIVLGS